MRLFTNTVIYALYIVTHTWAMYIVSPIWPVRLFFFFFLKWGNEISQAKKAELTVKLQLRDKTYIILMKKNGVHWQGVTAKFAFLACLCLVLSPLNDRLGTQKKKTKQKDQTDEEPFFSILWMVMGACLC